MAERPIFIPAPDESGFVETLSCSLVWSPRIRSIAKKEEHQSAT